jgi:hypothetical protein
MGRIAVPGQLVQKKKKVGETPSQQEISGTARGLK